MIPADPPTPSRVACISDSPELAAIISCHFNRPGEYLPVLSGPKMPEPLRDTDVTRKVNTCAMLRVERVIIAGLDDAEAATFREKIGRDRVVIVRSEAEASLALQAIGIPEPPDALLCRPTELMWGTLLAKATNRRLQVVETADSLRDLVDASRQELTHCVMVDDRSGVVPIIAANYAFATHASVRMLPDFDRDAVPEIYDQIQYTADVTSVRRRTLAERFVEEKLGQFNSVIRLDGLEFVTFITTGVPYGYFASQVPSTHLFSTIDLGRVIADSIYHARVVGATRLGLVVDPGFFADSESPLVASALRRRGIPVKEITGERATAWTVRNHFQFYPYDFLYICSHAGEIREGRRLTIRFRTADWREHTIVVDVVATFAPTDEGTGGDRLIEVMRFMGFVELDGVLWSDKEGKRRINAAETLQQFIQIDDAEWKIVEGHDVSTIREFVGIQATDGAVSVATHHVAGGGTVRPTVFNNACNSLYNFNTFFMHAGARGYIGTLASVGDDKAKEVARRFFESLTDDTLLPVHLWDVQRGLLESPTDRIYVHFGCHFNRLAAPRQDMTPYPRWALEREIQGWETYLRQDRPEELRRNAERVLGFLRRTLDEEGRG